MFGNVSAMRLRLATFVLLTTPVLRDGRENQGQPRDVQADEYSHAILTESASHCTVIVLPVALVV